LLGFSGPLAYALAALQPQIHHKMTIIKKTLKAIDEVAYLVPAIDAVIDDNGNVIAKPYRWTHKETGIEIVPDVILPCIHACEGDAENVRRGLAACWSLGVSAREVLAFWGRYNWKQVSCVVVSA